MKASYEAGAETVTKRLGDETVIVHLKTNRIYTLNQTGTRFWELLQERHPLDEIQRRMAEEFEVDPGRLEAEISGLIADLVAAGLVVSNGR